MITVEQAKRLKHGEILYHVRQCNVDGTPARWRVNGVPKTWKTRPNSVRVPLKHGLRDHSYLTEEEYCRKMLCLTEQEAIEASE